MSGRPPKQGSPALCCDLELRIMPLSTRKCLSGTWTWVAMLVLVVRIPLTVVLAVRSVVVEAFCDLFVQIQGDDIPFSEAWGDAQADADVAVFDIGCRLLALTQRLNDRTCEWDVVADENRRILIVLRDDLLIQDDRAVPSTCSAETREPKVR